MNKLEVFQANKFIESRQTYSVNEKRLLSTLISFVKPTDDKFIRYDLSIEEWAKLLKCTKENLYQIADDVTDGLVSKIIKIDKIGKDGNKAFKKFHVVSTSEYDAGVIHVEIDKSMNDILLQLKNKGNFTHYELAEFLTLTSTHAQRIYELIKQYQHSKKRERIITIDKLREMLGLEETSYKEYKGFRRNILDISLKQITKNTKLRYEWEGIKIGRKIHSIRFYNIHISGKENITEIQEKLFLENYIGEEIYHNEFGVYITIEKIEKNKDATYSIFSKFDSSWYDYKNINEVQECIAKAQVQQGLI